MFPVHQYFNEMQFFHYYQFVSFSVDFPPFDIH